MNDLDFYIEINARFAISENDEKNIYGVKNFSINIKKDNEELSIEDEIIGSASIIKIKTNDDALATLDYLAESEVFVLVFDEDWEFKDGAIKMYEDSTDCLLSPPIESIYILDRMQLKEQYRGKGLSKKVFDCIKEALNINNEYILLKVFPLQHENLNENFNEEKFLLDREKLINLYRDWGFTQIYNDNSDFIMIKDTQYI